MIRENVRELINGLPEGVELVAAAKTRSVQEILEAEEGGIKIEGENYVQEAEKAFRIIGSRVKWHFIGHLQKNKIQKAVRIFDMIETIDSLETLKELDKACSEEDKEMPVLIEINSGREKQKFGVMPEYVKDFLEAASLMRKIKIMGLMTMGPVTDNPEDARKYFSETRKIFEEIKMSNMPGIEMRYLSMGMSETYKVALEEGANIIRVGAVIFEPHTKF